MHFKTSKDCCYETQKSKPAYIGTFCQPIVLHNASSTSKNQQPPNIMIILADDLGFSDIGAYGGEIKTPHIDSLLKQGKMLFNFHASSMCSPTRAQLMTGADNHLVGLGAMYETSKRQEQLVGADSPRALLKIDGYSGHLTQNAYTLAEILKTKDYYTFMVGKWHLGYAPEQNPKARGFDQSFALLDGFDLHFKDQPKTIRVTPNTLKMVKRPLCLTTTTRPTFYTKSF